MYCSECKLRVADDGVVTCPVCQGALQFENEAGEQPESVDFVGELAAVFEDEQIPGVKLDDKLDAYVRDGVKPDFDPEELGLEASGKEGSEASADDIRVLADLWEKEDIGADLDGVFADVFNLEEVDPESSSEDSVAIKTESAAPEIPEEFIPEMATSVPTAPEVSTPTASGNSRNLGLPLLILVVLLVAGGGGWFYMQNTEVKSENKLVREVNSPAPAPVETQIKPQVQLEPAVVNNNSVDDKVVSVGEKSTVAEVPQPTGEAVVEKAVSENQGLITDTAPVTTGSSEAEEVAATSKVTTSDKVTQPAAESQVVPASVPGSRVASSSSTKPVVTGTPVANPESGTASIEKAVSESVSSTGNAAVTSEKSSPAATREVAATGPRYVVHMGSFRNATGATRQLAKLHKKGFAAYKVEVDLGEKGVWQRIFVPGGISKSAARQVQKQLAKSFPREESLIRRIKK